MAASSRSQPLYKCARTLPLTIPADAALHQARLQLQTSQQRERQLLAQLEQQSGYATLLAAQLAEVQQQLAMACAGSSSSAEVALQRSCQLEVQQAGHVAGKPNVSA